MLVPQEYFEPSILKEDIYAPCLAGGRHADAYCREYGFTDVRQFPKAYSDANVRRPGGSVGDVYAWGDSREILDELGSSRLGTLARWQPELEYEINLHEPGKHVIAIAFFTPEGVTGAQSIDVTAKDVTDPDEDASHGQAYIFNCTYSTLCRQVVTDAEGRVAEFDFGTNSAQVTVKVRRCR